MSRARWILALPAGFTAGLAAGFLVSWLGGFIGGSQWYTLLLSGAGSALAFVATSFRIAPRITSAFKWLTVGIVAALGTMSAIGSIFSDAPLHFITGGAMVVLAVAFGRMSPAELNQEVGLASGASHSQPGEGSDRFRS